MKNGNAFEVPPPGAGVKTLTFAVPMVAMSVAGIAAVNRVALTKVVGRSLSFHRTTELLAKFVPLTVRVNAAPPTSAKFGLKDVSVGAGAGGVIEKLRAFEVLPLGPGLTTVTLAVPAAAISVAGIAAVN